MDPVEVCVRLLRAQVAVFSRRECVMTAAHATLSCVSTPLQSVRQTCTMVAAHAAAVQIDRAALRELAERMVRADLAVEVQSAMRDSPGWRIRRGYCCRCWHAAHHCATVAVQMEPHTKRCLTCRCKGCPPPFLGRRAPLVQATAGSIAAPRWDEQGWHYNADAAEGGPLTAQYLLVLDALNWCFWVRIRQR
jgi:hypothetical protein